MTPLSREADLIDLHSHTTESDGSLTPAALVKRAVDNNLAALAITDHDTFAGYVAAVGVAHDAGLDLVRGIELNSRLLLEDGETRSAHLLGYFPTQNPSAAFTSWLESERTERRNRNRLLAEALQKRGVAIRLDDVESRGRSLAGRTHFAQLLVERGYARNFEDAFGRYLGEDAPSYVERQSQTTEQAIERVRSAGGVPVIAHPVRLLLSRDAEPAILRRLKDAGLLGLEVYHSDHSAELQAHYHRLAKELDLLPTGGSDFHGEVKPNIELGTGLRGNVRVPLEFLERMRRVAARLTDVKLTS